VAPAKRATLAPEEGVGDEGSWFGSPPPPRRSSGY
jgi:hypothetical protein